MIPLKILVHIKVSRGYKMRTLEMTNEELYYLADYVGIESLFGIGEVADFEEAKLSLINKGVVGTKGEVTDTTILHVKLLEMYVNSKNYFAFQNIIFGIQETGVCVIIAYDERKKTYTLQLGDMLTLLHIVSDHPRIEKGVISYYQQQYPQREIPMTHPEEQRSTLIMEVYDEEGECINYKYIWYEDQTYYELDENKANEKEVAEENYFAWIVNCFPTIMETSINQIVKEVEKSHG